MGKPSKWLNNLLRRCRRPRSSISPKKKPAISSSRHGDEDGIPNFAANCREPEFFSVGGGDSNKHAIAVAAATAAVAEAALAAARAAAEVVRLTNNVTPVSRRWCIDDLAAVKIQSAFRGFLARKALKALRGLVKLQALVRGHFVRKQSAEMLRRLQAMVRVQARARSNRILSIESSNSSPGNANTRSYEISASSEKLEESPVLKRSSSNSSIKDSKCSENAVSAPNWLDNWVEVGSSINNSNLTKTPHTDDEKNDKILEVDSWKPNSKSRSRNPDNTQPLRHISAKDYYDHSFAASDYLARYSPKLDPYTEDNTGKFGSKRTIECSSPQALSGASRTASMRRSPKTPSRDECSRSYLNGYSTFASPSYMANTQSSRARSRSHSVPRQREHDPEKLGSIKRSLHAFWESKTSTKRSFDSQRW